MKKFQLLFLSFLLFTSLTFVQAAPIGNTAEYEPDLTSVSSFEETAPSPVVFDEQIVEQVVVEPLKNNDEPAEPDVDSAPAIDSSPEPNFEQTVDRATVQPIEQPSSIDEPAYALVVTEPTIVQPEPPSQQPNDQPSFQPTPYSEQQKLAQFNWYNSYYDSLINEYGLIFNADEADSIYDIVQKKQALVEQHQQYIANQPDNLDISLEPISLDDERGYRFQLKVKVKDSNLPAETSIPDSISVNFTGGQSQLNSWWGISAQRVDLSPLKTAEGIVEVEVTTSLNANYDKLLVQIFSDVQFSGKSVFRQFTFDIAPTQTFDYEAYLQQNMLDQYNSLNAYYDDVIKSYGLEYTPVGTDTVYELVPKKKAFVEQYQVLQASIGIQQIPSGENDVYRFQVIAKIHDEYIPYIQTFPDLLKVSFSGWNASNNQWESISSETVDFLPLKTPGGTIDVEIPFELNDTTYDQLLVQANAVSLDAGTLLTSRLNVSALPTSADAAYDEQLQYVNEYRD